MVYGRYITIVNGVYKLIYNIGHHLVGSTTSLASPNSGMMVNKEYDRKKVSFSSVTYYDLQ